MLNVFMEEIAAKLYIQLPNGRLVTLEYLVRDYERLLNAISEPKDDKSTVSKLKVGEWFRIDREVIDKSKEEICRKCKKVGPKGKNLWKRFEKSNKIADENPDQYPRLIETYIFNYIWAYKTEQIMRDICNNVGNGMCDEVIFDLELQMRICNGEPVDNLVGKADKLPRVRVIKLRDGGTGFCGGGADNFDDNPPAVLDTKDFCPSYEVNHYTPYAFRRIFS